MNGSVVVSSLTQALFRRGVAILMAMLGVVALVTLAACTSTDDQLVPSDPLPDDPAAVVTVRVVDNSFEPAEVQLKAGQAVRWVFEGQAQHDVMAEDGTFVSELMRSGEYVHVFDEAGEWKYVCSVHPEMIGLVTVTD